MLSESRAGPGFDLPEELLEVLPSDPFQQLDVARKIASIALSTRVSALESEVSALHQQLTHRDAIISGLESQLDALDASLSEAAHKPGAAQQEKLSFTLKKLNRDVAKLEAFRQTLVRSLQEDEDNSENAPQVASPHVPRTSEDDATLPSTRTASMQSLFWDAGSSFDEDNESEVRAWVPYGLSQASQTSTPRLTPSASPPTLSASVSPPRTPKPVSPRQHSTSFSIERGFFDDKSSTSSSQYSSTSNLILGSQSAVKARVDGKEFFHQVRNQLSYEQFGAFLANVKELNSHKQTKEETLRKADEIFGQDNKDLYVIFEGLITRNVQ